MTPALLQGPEHVGVATALLRTGLAPYTHLKFPEVGEARVDQVAEQVLRARQPVMPMPAGLRELVPSS